jgi:hypothetical protein
MQGFYSAEEYDYQVEMLTEQGMSFQDALDKVDAQEKLDYEEFAQWKQEQDEIVQQEELALEQDAGINDSWYEDQYDVMDF